VEGGVEHRHLRPAGKCGARGVQAVDRRAVVQRRQLRELGQHALHVLVHDDGLAEARAPVHHAMADRGHLGGQRVQALDRPLLLVLVDDGELQARRAGVDDEDRP
jgi:hypothetical protein